jgi:hypothetical protein
MLLILFGFTAGRLNESEETVAIKAATSLIPDEETDDPGGEDDNKTDKDLEVEIITPEGEDEWDDEDEDDDDDWDDDDDEDDEWDEDEEADDDTETEVIEAGDIEEDQDEASDDDDEDDWDDDDDDEEVETEKISNPSPS